MTTPTPPTRPARPTQLARAATDLAHDLRVVAEGRRLRCHLVEVHSRTELADRQQNAEVWAGDHLAGHYAGVPAGTHHTHEEGPADG
jgi:hypothetical protein